MNKTRRKRKFLCSSRLFFGANCKSEGVLFFETEHQRAYLCQEHMVKYLLKYHHIDVYTDLVMDSLKDDVFEYTPIIVKVTILAYLTGSGSSNPVNDGVLNTYLKDDVHDDVDWDSLPNDALKRVVDAYKDNFRRYQSDSEWW